METVRIVVGTHHPPATAAPGEIHARRGAWIETPGQGEGDLLQRALEVQADAVVVDLGEASEDPRGGSGMGARTLVLCLHPESEPLGEQTIRATACAFLLGTDDRAAVEHVVTSVHTRTCQHGRRPPLANPTALSVPPERLNENECRLLTLLAQEKSSKEIAVVMDLSPRTVDAHRSKLMRKLGVQTTVGLVGYAIRAGLVVA